MVSNKGDDDSDASAEKAKPTSFSFTLPKLPTISFSWPSLAELGAAIARKRAEAPNTSAEEAKQQEVKFYLRDGDKNKHWTEILEEAYRGEHRNSEAIDQACRDAYGSVISTPNTTLALYGGMLEMHRRLALLESQVTAESDGERDD